MVDKFNLNNLTEWFLYNLQDDIDVLWFGRLALLQYLEALVNQGIHTALQHLLCRGRKRQMNDSPTVD